MSTERVIRQGFFISVRLREERERLGLTQDNVATFCSVAASTVRDWEKERAIPGDKLALLISCGFDVQYVLSGCHSVNMDQVGLLHGEGKPLEHAADPGSKTFEEQSLLIDYRRLDELARSHVRILARALMNAK
jgi:transcriptional regulator with XRE-family HTH domain